VWRVQRKTAELKETRYIIQIQRGASLPELYHVEEVLLGRGEEEGGGAKKLGTRGVTWWTLGVKLG